VHVGLNLVFLVPGETGGMEVAARELIPALRDAAPGIRFTAFVNREAAGEDFGVESAVVPVAATNRVEWVRGEQQHLPRMAAQAGCGLLHSLGSTAPLHGRVRRVTTINDLNFLFVPEAHFGLRALGMRALVPLAARTAHRIIAISESTRRDVVERLRVPPGKIDAVPLGVRQPPGGAVEPPEALRARLDLGKRPVVLCPGAKRPHKNALRVIEAIAAMDERPALVVSGYKTPYEDTLRERAAQLGVELRLPDYLDAAAMEGLYALADCVVVASLYEGFGLPVLEAMARGVPVACSDRSSLPEVAGDAALLFSPDDPQAIRAALERLLRDPAEAGRLRAAGRARAARFTWARTAELTLASYERALSAA
jgi:glycosyltransferase involved in cell wall biosynthesis